MGHFFQIATILVKLGVTRFRGPLQTAARAAERPDLVLYEIRTYSLDSSACFISAEASPARRYCCTSTVSQSSHVEGAYVI